MKSELRKAKLIIADDSDIWQRCLLDLLQDCSELIITAQVSDAASAFHVSSQLRPDIVLLDIFMPGGGIEALSAIKQLQPRPIIIMATGLPEPDMEARCLASGADHFFDKNSDVVQLLALLRQLARKTENQNH